MTYFGKLVGNEIERAPSVLVIGTRTIFTPSIGDYLSSGWSIVTDEPPTAPDGYEVVRVGYDESESGIVVRYEVREIKPTITDYDYAMEEHLREERTARGYSTREPSEYVGSSVSRWATDAADWIKHRDAVMLYGLGVINAYEQTGVAPSLAEFRTNLPRIVWTIEEAV